MDPLCYTQHIHGVIETSTHNGEPSRLKFMAERPTYEPQLKAQAASLNTNTGPQANGESFGAGVGRAMGDLAQGLRTVSLTADEIAQRQMRLYEARQREEAKGKARQAVTDAREKAQEKGETEFFPELQADLEKIRAESIKGVSGDSASRLSGGIAKTFAEEIAPMAMRLEASDLVKRRVGDFQTGLTLTVDNAMADGNIAGARAKLEEFNGLSLGVIPDDLRMESLTLASRSIDLAEIDQVAAHMGESAAIEGIRAGALGKSFDDTERGLFAQELEARAMKNLRDADFTTETHLKEMEDALIRGESASLKDRKLVAVEWAAARSKKDGSNYSDNLNESWSRINRAIDTRQFDLKLRTVKTDDLAITNPDTLEPDLAASAPEGIRHHAVTMIKQELDLRENDPATAAMRGDDDIQRGLAEATALMQQAMNGTPEQRTQARAKMEDVVGRSLKWQSDMGVGRPMPLTKAAAIEHANVIRKIAEQQPDKPEKAYQHIELLGEIYGRHAADVYRQMQQLPGMDALKALPFTSNPSTRGNAYVHSYLSKIRNVK